MIHKILSVLAIAGVIFLGTDSYAADNNANNQKPVSTVSQLNNAQDDDVVYIQGNLTQNLGDNMYVFTDGSGNVNIEIDEDLLQGNTVTPEATVWIEATVDKNGDVTSLDAEEVDFVPNNGNN